MKWKKFLQFLQQNSDIEPWIRQHIGPPVLSSNADQMSMEDRRREFVERNFSIGTRDFDILSLKEVDYEIRENVSQEDTRRSGYGWVYHCSRVISVRHFLHFHIEGADVPHERVLFLEPGNGEEAETLSQAIESCLEWYSKYWAKQGKAIKFGFVVKRVRVWEKDKREGIEKNVSEKIEIYRFPRDFNLEPATQAA